MAERTPTPWRWVVHDYSMASIEGPGEELDHVLSVNPCDSCIKHAAEPKEWEWGRCKAPSEADAKLIVRAVNSHQEIVDLLAEIRKWMDADIMGPWDARFLVQIDAALAKATQEDSDG